MSDQVLIIKQYILISMLTLKFQSRHDRLLISWITRFNKNLQ